MSTEDFNTEQFCRAGNWLKAEKRHSPIESAHCEASNKLGMDVAL